MSKASYTVLKVITQKYIVFLNRLHVSYLLNVLFFELHLTCISLKPIDRKTKIRLEESTRHSGTIRANYIHEWNNYRLNVNLNGRLQGKKFVKSTEKDAPKYQIWNLTTNHSFSPVGMFLFEINAGVLQERSA